VGGGGIIALTYVIISDMVSLRDRGKWFGIISLHWAIGATFRPIIGGGKEAL
jgi:MFS family permease